MSQTHTVGSHKTVCYRDVDSGLQTIIYHRTKVVQFDHTKVILNSAGYFTATTKSRMNQAASQYGLGYQVFQKGHVWYVTLPDGTTVPYRDGMEIPLKN